MLTVRRVAALPASYFARHLMKCGYVQEVAPAGATAERGTGEAHPCRFEREWVA